MLHSFLNSIPQWEEVSLVCGDLPSNTNSISSLFTLQKTHLISKFKLQSVQLDLHIHAQKILSEFPLNSSFGLSIVIFSTRSEEIENAFDSAISLLNSSASLQIFSLDGTVSIGSIKETVAEFSRVHYQTTECSLTFGAFSCSFILFPSFYSLSEKIRGDLSISNQWQLNGMQPISNDLSCEIVKMKLKVDFVCHPNSESDPFLRSFIVHNLLGNQQAKPVCFQLQDIHSNYASLSLSACGRFIEFRLHSFFSPSSVHLESESELFLPSYISCNLPDSFPFFSEESLSELLQKLVKAAQAMDENRFMQSFTKFQSIVLVYKSVQILDELEEALLLEGADSKFVELNNDLRNKICPQ